MKKIFIFLGLVVITLLSCEKEELKDQTDEVKSINKGGNGDDDITPPV